MKYWPLFIQLLAAIPVLAQNDPEFPKGTVLYLSLQQGKTTTFNSSPELWVGGFGISPQFTVIPQRLRLGATGEFSYTNKQGSGLFGPRVALKVKTLKTEPLGSILNFQLQAEHLWGTRNQRLVGGSFTVEIFQLFSVHLSSHRDYKHDQWWFRGGIGVNVIHKKKSGSTDPLSKK